MTSNENNESNLPKILKIYSNTDFNLQLKVRVFYNMNIAAIVAVIILLISSIYTQIIGSDQTIDLQIVVPISIIFFIFFACLLLLIKGHFSLSTHIFLISANIGVWYVMFYGSNNMPIIKLDTIVLILAIINSIPLFISRFKITILVYVLVNIVVLLLFIYYFKTVLLLNDSIVIDYFIDITTALIFSGVAAYQIIRINNKTTEKLEQDYKKRIEAEQALQKSEQLRRNVFESSQIPIIVMESDTFEYIDINPAGIKVYGYKNKDEALGKTPNDVSAPMQYDGTPSEEKALKYIDVAIKKGSVTFEWLHQRPDGEKWDAEVHLLSFQSENKNFLQFSLIDITEKKKAEKALVSSQRLFQTLAEASPVGIFRTKPDGFTTYVNPKWSELSGMSFEQAQGDEWLKAVHPDDRKLLLDNWKKHSSEGKQSIAEYRFLKDNGEITWVLGSAVPEIVDGELQGYVGTITNITDLKKADQELKESEERYRNIFENAQIGIYQTTPDGRILQSNPALVKMLGFDSLDELTGRNTNEPSAYVNSTRKSFVDLIEKQGYVIDFESEWKKKNNDTIIVKVNARAVRDDSGKTIFYEGFVENITEIKKADQELKESEERYRIIVEAFPDIIMISDLNKKILFANKELEKITGILPEEYDNPYESAQVHPEDRELIDNVIKDLLEGDKQHTGIIENRFIDKNGKVHWLSGIISKVKIDNQIYLQTITRDITEKKIIEQELEQHRNNLEHLVKKRTEELAAANEELISTNDELLNQREELENVLENLKKTQNKLIQVEKMASLGVLASGVAHEINNPLNFIKGGAFGIEQYINENMKEHKEELDPLIEGINIGIDRAANIVTSLSHYSRKNETRIIRCDVHKIIDNCLVILQNQIKSRIEVNKNYTTQDYVLLGNEGKLHQAMLNILTNAVQAIDKKGQININTKIENNKFLIYVEDTGCGIKNENLTKIFDPFYTTKEAGEGTGLGLSITFNIIKDHHGTIDVSSELNNGTKIKIILPLQKK